MNYYGYEWFFFQLVCIHFPLSESSANAEKKSGSEHKTDSDLPLVKSTVTTEINMARSSRKTFQPNLVWKQHPNFHFARGIFHVIPINNIPNDDDQFMRPPA